MSNHKEAKSFSRFGYIMVAAGAAIGLGNIWKFPYLAYGDGGGAFVLVYIVICILLGHPIVQAEQAVGRRGRASAAASYGVIHPKWRFVGVINIVCTFLIDIYYLVVSGWVLKYFVTYVVSGDFGKDKQAYFDNYISSTTQPLIYSLIIMWYLCIDRSARSCGRIEVLFCAGFQQIRNAAVCGCMYAGMFLCWYWMGYLYDTWCEHE